jgi:hypothetical protein
MKMLLLALLLVAQRVPSPAVQVGTITGRLLNEDGSPAIKVRVSAMAIPQNANEAPTLMTLAETDNTGRYRLADVLVGRYYIVAGFVDSPTYFPRGTTAARATPVSVTANATVANIDFRIEKPSTGVTVSGRVITESNPSSGTIQVSLSGGGGSGGYTNLNVPVKLDGSFDFVRVRSGTYTISVGPTPIPEQRTVVVVDKDVTGPGASHSVDDRGQRSRCRRRRWPHPELRLSFSGGNRQIQAGYYQGANQSFRVTLPEGYYVTTVSGMPSGYFLKSLTTRDVSLLSAPLHVARTDVPSEIWSHSGSPHRRHG